MRLAQTLDSRQQQTQRIDPRQILASEILAWNTQELEAAVERELAENPALEAADGGDTIGGLSSAREPDPVPSLTASRETVDAPPLPRTETERADTDSARRELSERMANERANERSNERMAPVGGAFEDENPLERVASSVTLREHLRTQVGQAVSTDHDIREDVLRYLIENVDERGYLIADVIETAERFGIVRAEIERAVRALQAMDPAGVGARDVRECLTLQAEFLEQAGEGHPLARKILSRCWDELIARREERIAARLKATSAEVKAALLFLQRALTPYPGALFRADNSRSSAGSPPVRPDLIFIRTEAGYSVELARDFEVALLVAPLWRKLADTEQGGDEAMRRYIREHVDRAQSFLNGVSRRGRTLRAIAREIMRVQIGYLETRNRAFLRPLTRQALAEKLHLDESVISRAVADKWVQLPSGEILPLDVFFGNSQAVREALLHLIAAENPENPYSDDEIAEMLTSQGYPLARRTVAKYRGLERILPARLRKRARAA